MYLFYKMTYAQTVKSFLQWKFVLDLHAIWITSGLWKQIHLRWLQVTVGKREAIRTMDFCERKIISLMPGEVYRPIYGKCFEYTWDPGLVSLSSVNISSWKKTVPKTSRAIFLSKRHSWLAYIRAVSSYVQSGLSWPPVFILEINRWILPHSNTIHSGNN